MPRAPRQFDLAVPDSQDEMRRTPREGGFAVPELLANANFECQFCFHQFMIQPEPPSDELADLCSLVWNHIWKCHREQWERSKEWTKRIHRRKARTDLLD